MKINNNIYGISFPILLFYLNELNNKMRRRYIIDSNAVAHFKYDELGFSWYYIPTTRVSESGFTSKQRKKVIYGREKHRKRRR